MQTSVLRKPYLPDYSKMASSNDASYHLVVSNNFLLEVNSHLKYLLSSEYTNGLKLEYAVIIGHLNKLESLNDELRKQSKPNGNYEFQSIFYRQIVEVVANIFYFMEDIDNINNYIASSLSNEKEFLDLMKFDREKHGIDNTDREKRQQEYINKVCNPAGLNESDLMSAKEIKEKGLSTPEVKQRMKSLRNLHSSYVDGIYQGYRVGSTILHSNWQDIVLHHLVYDEKQKVFSIKQKSTSPIADTNYSACSLSVHAIMAYLDFIEYLDKSLYAVISEVRTLSDDFNSRSLKAFNAHEQALKTYGRFFV